MRVSVPCGCECHVCAQLQCCTVGRGAGNAGETAERREYLIRKGQWRVARAMRLVQRGSMNSVCSRRATEMAL